MITGAHAVIGELHEREIIIIDMLNVANCPHAIVSEQHG